MDEHGNPSAVEGCILTWTAERCAIDARALETWGNYAHSSGTHKINIFVKRGWLVQLKTPKPPRIATRMPWYKPINTQPRYRIAKPSDPHICIKCGKKTKELFSGKCKNCHYHRGGRACTILEVHQKDVADDLEALDPTFMQELIGIDCDYDDVDISEFAKGGGEEDNGG